MHSLSDASDSLIDLIAQAFRSFRIQPCSCPLRGSFRLQHGLTKYIYENTNKQVKSIGSLCDMSCPHIIFKNYFCWKVGERGISTSSLWLWIGTNVRRMRKKYFERVVDFAAIKRVLRIIIRFCHCHVSEQRQLQIADSIARSGIVVNKWSLWLWVVSPVTESLTSLLR